MRFGGRSVAKITAEDIEQLVGDKDAEDGSLEFKRDAYSRSDGGKKEFLRDVISFANADGGYIIIGIEEVDHCASSLCHIDQANDEAGRLRDLCLQNIQPRIRDLEIIAKPIHSKNIEIILIHIPESAARPHMATFNDGTYFCRRYHDRKRSMSIEELHEAFGQRTATSHPGVPDELRSDINKLASILSANRLADLQPSEPIENATCAREVRKIMNLRFREQIGDRPYFRITSTPVDTTSVDLSGSARELLDLLTNPPQTRQNGWVIYSPAPVKRNTEGWHAISPGDSALILLNNGHLEYWHPCDDSLFQWGRQTVANSSPELFPFAVCELPVNFTRLAKQVYHVSGFTGKISFKMEYVNIREFVLRPGVPNSIAYMMPTPRLESRASEQDDIRTSDLVVNADFNPDVVAFQLVEQVYSVFGIDRTYIPCFENGQRFDISVNSSQ